MPIYKELTSNLRIKHTAERLQILFKRNDGITETVAEMQPQIFFECQVERVISGTGETAEVEAVGEPYLDKDTIYLDPANDVELAEAFSVIQQKIGLLRYQQLHAPHPEPEPDPLVQG